MISVIVPVYKVEQQLSACVESILSQTYTDYELLLIDDGSPDKCPQICDEYATKYNNILAFHKTNGGLSDARNYGVAKAKGDYVTFIDSDDVISNNYLERLATLQNKYNSTMSVGCLKKCLEVKQQDKINKKNDFCCSGEEALKMMLYQNKLDTSACCLLIPKETALNNPFPKGKYHEDEFTTYKYYLSSKSVSITTENLYYYIQRQGSIMHSVGQATKDEIEAADNLVNFCSDKYPNLVKAAESKKYSDYCQVLLSSPELYNQDRNLYLRIVDYLKQKRWQIILDKNTRIKNKVAAFLLFFGVEFLKKINEIKGKL